MGKVRTQVPKILPSSLHKTGGWKAHWSRVERWYGRLMGASDKDDILDFSFAFFQSCAMLPDWLTHSKAVCQDDLASFLRAHPELGVCRDVSNVTKHYTLTSASQTHEVSILREYCPPNSPYFRGGYCDGNARFLIVADDKNYEVRELAHTCLELWRGYLKSVNTT